VILCASGVIIAHPFHVISVRMMAQFVGQEQIYTGLLVACKEIYRTEGFTGFFNGLMPRILWDVGYLVLTLSTVFGINRYISKEKVKKQYSLGVTQYFDSNLLYPFHGTSTCMCVNGARLIAAKPPLMACYPNWIYCTSDLFKQGELKRGNSFLLRSAKPLCSDAVLSDLKL